MKNTRKLTAILLCLTLALSLAACSGVNGGENTPPSISGVADQAVEAGSQFDALAGVAASDAEDGDITGMITVKSVPELTFTNGKTTPEDAGSYELTYSVTDKGGETAEAYATLTVTRKTGEAVELVSFDFSDITPDSHGWEAVIGEKAKATGELKSGAFVFDIENPGEGDGDVKLSKPGFELKAADYKLKVWAKSTAETYAHMFARNEAAEGWELFGDAYNMKIGTSVAPLELNFTSPGEGTAELLIHLGKISPNPDNPADTTPENFTVTIDKIEIYEITGAQTEVPVYTADFADETAVALSAGDGANGSAAVADGKGVFTIENYPTEGGVWSIKADLGLGGNAIEAGAKYYYKVTVVSENAQAGELLVESASMADKARANFNGLALNAGEETVITQTFTAENSVDDPVIRMQIGNPAEGVTGNTITVTAVEFGKLEGDLETHKTIDSFSTARTDAEDYTWGVYNGTDEDNELGVGTIWTEGGKLYYRIDQGGTVDWHNKLYMNLDLPADSYFTVEITGKATAPVSCGFFLNPAGSWDPRVSEGIDFTTEEQTFTFDTTDTLIMDMPFEMLFQFGSADLAAMGEVTVELSSITIYQRSVA